MYRKPVQALLCVCVLLFLLAACKIGPAFVQGMKKDAKGNFYYKLIRAPNPKPLAQTGEQLEFDYTLQKAEQVLDASYFYGLPFYVQMPIEEQDIFFTRALRLMGEGDSLILHIPAKEIRPLLGEYNPLFKDDDWVTSSYKLRKVKSQAQYQAELAEAQGKAEQLRQEGLEALHRFQKKDTSLNFTYSPSGLAYHIIEQGQGKRIKKGHWLQIQLLCYLEDGHILQDTYASSDPYTFTLGKDIVIAGWEEAMPLFSQGTKAYLIIPPHLAYGPEGLGELIPAGQNLFFYIEVLAVE